MIPIDLHGRRALVTGGTGELGRVICRVLGRCGAEVCIHTHSQIAMAKKLSEEICSFGVKAHTVQADITSFESLKKMKEDVLIKMGHPDIIINNAVIQYPNWERILEQPVEDYISQFESTVLHNIFMVKLFVPAMLDAKFGRVIIINTECASQCLPGHSAYVGGKRGLDGVARILAKEVGSSQITVNQVAPGAMISENRPKTDSHHYREYCDKVPLGRKGFDVDVANTVAFLASDLANFITGAFIPVSGGTVMPAI